MKKIKVRPMTGEELLSLGESDWTYVPDHGRRDALVPARLHQGLLPGEVKALEKYIADGAIVPSFGILTLYGSLYSARATEFFVEDPEGEERPVIETVGTQVSMAIYVPGMEGPDVLERMRKALRAEFGAGLLQLRQETHRPVPETGLPPVLGVPNGHMPELI